MRVSSQIFVTEEYTDGSSKIQMIVDILSGWSFGILEPWNFMTFHIKKILWMSSSQAPNSYDFYALDPSGSSYTPCWWRGGPGQDRSLGAGRDSRVKTPMLVCFMYDVGVFHVWANPGEKGPRNPRVKNKFPWANSCSFGVPPVLKTHPFLRCFKRQTWAWYGLIAHGDVFLKTI